MNIRMIMSILLIGTGQACCAMESDEKIIPSSVSHTLERVEKKDLMGRVMRALPASEDKEVKNQVMRKAQEILDESYESDMRPIKDPAGKTKYGQAFPINPEVLADIIDFSQGKTVLELGAARGENAILLGLSGAQEVYINELQEAEVAACRDSINSLPEDIKAIFTQVPGNCLEVFESDEYTEKFDVIYARNILHFFFGEKRDKFITMVQRLLKPGGRLIINTNSQNVHISPVVLEKYPDTYVFKQRIYFVRTANQNFPQTSITDIEDNLEDVDLLRYRWVRLLAFRPKGIVGTEDYQALSAEEQKIAYDLADSIQEQSGGVLSAMLQGYTIEVHETQVACYTKRTIENAFSDVDLTLLQAVSIDEKGHATSQDKEANLTTIFEKPISQH